MLNSVPKFAQCETRPNFFKSWPVFKVENRNKKNLNSRIFRKTHLGNLVMMMYSKFQCNRKARSKLNHVPKFAQKVSGEREGGGRVLGAYLANFKQS